MKKIWLATLVLIVGAVLIACTAFPGNTTSSTSTEALADPLDVLAYQAVSATELLIGVQTPTALTAQPLGFHLMDSTTGDEPAVSEDIDILDRYLSMMEQFLGADNGLGVTLTESDLPEYEVKVVFTTRTLSGADVTYILYYNETVLASAVPDGEDETITTPPVEGETETTEEETGDTSTADPLRYGNRQPEGTPREEPYFNSFDEDDENVVSLLEGILIVGDLTYQLEGRTIEDDEERIMILRSFIDSDNGVCVRYQIDAEDGDRKFFYEAKVDGVILSRSKVKVQVEDGERKVRLEFLDASGKGRYDFKEVTEDNITYIKIRYSLQTADGEEQGMIHIQATYDEVTGLTTYEYVLRPENGCAERRIEKEHEEHRGDGHGDHHHEDDEKENPEIEDGSESEGDLPLVSGDDILIG